mmetsp:Transcript_31106/g.27379  ORF Transcript_31106/g.27379 Transcript_31106/m.27379 type:complete len:536 (-) Transcript_31106:14-1621(-)
MAAEASSTNIIYIDLIDRGLRDYYTALKVDTYWDVKEDKGEFKKYCFQSGLEEYDDFKTEVDEFIKDNDDEEDLGNNIIYNSIIEMQEENKIKNQDEKEICRVIQTILKTGSPPKINKEIDQFELEVTSKEIEKTTKLYQAQTYSLLGANGLKDCILMEFFAIGYRNNDFSFLNNVVDSFTRDHIAAANKKKGAKNLHLDEWMKENTFLSKLHNKNEGKASRFKSAVNSYLIRIAPRLQIKQEYLICDSIQQISHYIIAITAFIKKLLDEYEAKPPFMIDFMVVVKDSELDNDGNELPDLGDDSSDDDDDDDEDEKDSKIDRIGDIEQKLKDENCRYVGTKMNLNQVKDSQVMLDRFTSIYNEFKEGDTYPTKRRFNVAIDRREDKDGLILFFEPPSNCDKMPEDGHVIEWYFNATKQCLIPGKGYNSGKGDKTTTLNGSSKTDGQLITFSFHIESLDEIKCYLFYNGCVSRFYGQDIMEIFPNIFDMEYEDNMKFTKNDNEKTIEIAKNIVLSDLHFETFYKSFGNDKSFPKYK